VPKQNRFNPKRGRDFEKIARKLLSAHFGVELHPNHSIAIGDPPKIHKFDLGSEDSTVAGECKNYSWTKVGHIPSAKMAFLNEAVLYLSHLPRETTRFIAMRRDTHHRRTESLADYYSRTYRHFLSQIQLLEIDLEARQVRRVPLKDVLPGQPTPDDQAV
jgi:hypothetical protein